MNHDFEVAATAARHRALHALDKLGTSIASTRELVNSTNPAVYLQGSDAWVLLLDSARLIEALTELETLREVAGYRNGGKHE